MDLKGYSDAQGKSEKVKTLMSELQVSVYNKNVYSKNYSRIF